MKAKVSCLGRWFCSWVVSTSGLLHVSPVLPELVGTKLNIDNEGRHDKHLLDSVSVGCVLASGTRKARFEEPNVA